MGFYLELRPKRPETTTLQFLKRLTEAGLELHPAWYSEADANLRAKYSAEFLAPGGVLWLADDEDRPGSIYGVQRVTWSNSGESIQAIFQESMELAQRVDAKLVISKFGVLTEKNLDRAVEKYLSDRKVVTGALGTYQPRSDIDSSEVPELGTGHQSEGSVSLPTLDEIFGSNEREGIAGDERAI